MPAAWLLVLAQVTMPAVLLGVGHRYPHRSRASKRFFWGGIVGYVTSILMVTALLLTPPVFWGAEGSLRWLAIQWTPLVLPLAAATGARLASRSGEA